MSSAPIKSAGLPEDAASLKALLRSLMAAHEQEKQRADGLQRTADALQKRAEQQSSFAASLQKKSDELYIENLRLQVEVDRFKRWYYGPRADKLTTALELGQMLLAFGEQFENKPVNKDDLSKDEKPEERPRRVRKARGRRIMCAESMPARAAMPRATIPASRVLKSLLPLSTKAFLAQACSVTS